MHHPGGRAARNNRRRTRNSRSDPPASRRRPSTQWHCQLVAVPVGRVLGIATASGLDWRSLWITDLGPGPSISRRIRNTRREPALLAASIITSYFHQLVQPARHLDPVVAPRVRSSDLSVAKVRLKQRRRDRRTMEWCSQLPLGNSMTRLGDRDTRRPAEHTSPLQSLSH